MSGFYEESIRLGEECEKLKKKLAKAKKEIKQHKRAAILLASRLGDRNDFICPSEKVYNEFDCKGISCGDCWEKWAYKEDEK